MELTGRVAWITGGARIGATVALELARRGCRLVLTYRTSRSSAEKAAAAVREEGAQALVLRADVTQEPDVTRAVRRIESVYGRLDILVNMASTYKAMPYLRLERNQWQRDFDANATSAFLATKAATTLLTKAGGRVINIADWVTASGRPRYKDFLAYYTAKTAVLGLTQALALELAPRVLVNAIAPGPILPPAGIRNEEVRNVASVTPLRRWGGPLEVAKAVLFFCDSDFVTGECVRVDGGRHLY